MRGMLAAVAVLIVSAFAFGPASAADRLTSQIDAQGGQIAWELIPPGDLAIKVRWDCRQPGEKTRRGAATVVIGNDLTVRTGDTAGELVAVHAERDFNRFRLYAAAVDGFSCKVSTSY